MTLRIGIVEDSQAISDNWVALLSAQPGFQCVGAFQTGEVALQHLPGLKPDVVLMDISLPGMSGIECVAKLKRLLPRTSVLIITVHSDNDRLFQALKSIPKYHLKPLLVGAGDVFRGASSLPPAETSIRAAPRTEIPQVFDGFKCGS